MYRMYEGQKWVKRAKIKIISLKPEPTWIRSVSARILKLKRTLQQEELNKHR